jgi:hypothetical protein
LWRWRWREEVMVVFVGSEEARKVDAPHLMFSIFLGIFVAYSRNTDRSHLILSIAEVALL